MAVKDLYLIDFPPKESFLNSDRNLLIVTSIFQKAIEKFISIYNSYKVPLTFIEFYIDEIKNYEYLFKIQMKEFFNDYNTICPNINSLANVYNKSFYSLSTGLEKIEDETYLVVDENGVVSYIEDIIENSDREIGAAVSNLIQITSHINDSDELLPFYEIYENYMIRRLIKKEEFNNKYNGKSNLVINVVDNSEKPEIVSAIKKAERLTSERIQLSKQKGKITKIVIPKLKLPSAYPKTTTFNRFNSKYKVNNFISATREVLILNDLKINGVSYSSNFIEKRKVINEENK